MNTPVLNQRTTIATAPPSSAPDGHDAVPASNPPRLASARVAWAMLAAVVVLGCAASSAEAFCGFYVS
ncbi:MAG: hypothetical protein AAFX99_28520, partial [Myxococcota bacterium]